MRMELQQRDCAQNVIQKMRMERRVCVLLEIFGFLVMEIIVFADLVQRHRIHILQKLNVINVQIDIMLQAIMTEMENVNSAPQVRSNPPMAGHV